ncbi:MAG: tetratricopeptide repeat protein [Sedimentitalea sp.]
MQDRFGNSLNTNSGARDAYVGGGDLFLAGRFGAVEAFEDAVQHDPGFALGFAGLARARMMSGDMAGAQAALATAQGFDSCARAQSQIAVLALLLGGQAAAARAAVFAHVAEYPRDAMVAQICTNVFGLIGFSGAPGREAALLAYTAQLLAHYGDDWWMMSMHALSLCETGQTEAAITLMERSLAMEPDNANGAHFKSHAQYEAGETRAGLAYLDGWMEGYDARSVLHGHLSWHQALWALQAGDTARMWAVVDASVGPGASQGLAINVLTDTASILYRAHLAGEPVDPARWRALSDYARQFFPDPGLSFADMHAALAHAMGGAGDALAHIINGARGPVADLVAPVAETWRAVAAQDWAGALERLTPVMGDNARLGGSRAQRDLLEFAYVNILLKLNRADEAHRMLAMRRPVLIGGSVPVAGWAS